MSFSFNVVGDREQASAQLLAIAADENQDSLRNAVASLLAEHVGASELHSYEQGGTCWRQVYVIEVGGHSGPQSAMSLHVDMKVPYLCEPKSTELEAVDL